MSLSFPAAKGKRESQPKEPESQEDNRAVVQSCERNTHFPEATIRHKHLPGFLIKRWM